MSLSLLKIAIAMTASQPTTTAYPTVKNFFHIVPSGGLSGTSFTIDDEDWTDDDGDPVAVGGLTTVTSNNGYAQLMINGAVQEAGVLATLSADEVVITFTGATTIDENELIVLTVTNFAPITTAPVIS